MNGAAIFRGPVPVVSNGSNGGVGAGGLGELSFLQEMKPLSAAKKTKKYGDMTLLGIQKIIVTPALLTDMNSVNDE